MLIVGEKEQENQEVSIRKQGQGDLGSKKVTTFAVDLVQEVEQMINNSSY
jgi:threonyl-tRNA synthetase